MMDSNQIVEANNPPPSSSNELPPAPPSVNVDLGTTDSSNLPIEDQVAAALNLSEDGTPVQDIPLGGGEVPDQSLVNDPPLFEAPETTPPAFQDSENAPPKPPVTQQEVDLGGAGPSQHDPYPYSYYNEEEQNQSSWANVIPLDKIKNGLRVAGDALEPLVYKTGEKLTEAGQAISQTEIAQKTAQKVQEIHESERVVEMRQNLHKFVQETSEKAKNLPRSESVQNIRTKWSGFVQQTDEKTKPMREQAAADIALFGYTAKEKCTEAYIDAKPKLEEFGKAASQRLKQGGDFLGAQFQNLRQNIAKRDGQDGSNDSNPPHVV